MSEEVDITKAANDLANEKIETEKAKENDTKISDLESQLADYKKKEDEAIAAEEEKRKSDVNKRIDELEASGKKTKEEYEKKLETLSTRQTSAKSADPKSALSREDYDKDKDKYNQMLAQHILKTGSLR